MLFNSLTFGVFLAVVVPVVHALPRRGQNLLLVGASYLFYGWWDWRFLLPLVVSTIVDFWASRRIASTGDPTRRRRALMVSLATNLSILGFFKYCNFFVDSFAATMEVLGVRVDGLFLDIVLPVGISFYTFQTMAYTIDVYRKRLKPTDDLVSFMLYVAFFPQLMAGPIERARRLLPQLESDRILTPTLLRRGLALLVLGWFKKVGIADGVAPFVDEIFAEPGSFSSGSLLLGGMLFSLQVYGDFSGYSAMARGAAALLGVDLMINFKQPFLSNTINDFWRRWHISLSSWFTDYIYIPLGGSRGSEARTAFNLATVFAVSGLWHGAAWNFVFWGAINGLAVIICRIWSRLPRNRDTEVPIMGVRWWLGCIATNATFALGLLFFRCNGLEGVWTVCMALAISPLTVGPESTYLIAFVVYGLAVFALDFWQFRSGEQVPMTRLSSWGQGLALAGAVLWVLVFGSVDLDVAFVYFQF